jgi:hypothetical protein
LDFINNKFFKGSQMKYYVISLILLLSVSCTRKYQHLGTVHKATFQDDNLEKPMIPTRPLLKGRKDTETFCEGQILFQKNAHDITENSLRSLVKYSCPGDKYLQDVIIQRTWWTTLIYSKSCIEVQSTCTK